MGTVKKIPGYPGYCISLGGTVYKEVNGELREIKSSVTNGKLKVNIKTPDKKKTIAYVDNLLMLAYPEGNPVENRGKKVIHKDCNNMNSDRSNLTMGYPTRGFNKVYKMDVKTCREASKTVTSGPGYYILQFTKEHEFVTEWKSISQVARAFGCDTHNIITALQDETKTAYGFYWWYKALYVDEFTRVPKKKLLEIKERSEIGIEPIYTKLMSFMENEIMKERKERRLQNGEDTVR